jgi:hypothetical protein
VERTFIYSTSLDDVARLLEAHQGEVDDRRRVLAGERFDQLSRRV